jgi:AraC-like DNA-binding protein
MLDFNVRMVQCFEEAQRNAYVNEMPSVGLSISGDVFHRWDGVDLGVRQPFLSITPPGVHLDYEYDEDRENWVVGLVTDDFRKRRNPAVAQVRCGGQWVSLPSLTPVDPENVPGLRDEMMRMREAFLSADPRSRFRLKTGVINFLRRMIDRQADTLRTSPAMELKRLIDDDETFSESLKNLAGKCRYSSNHLRILFRRTFGVNPHAYRTQRRMARAVDLVSNSQLSVKEIAAATGFEHVSHFCTMFRKTFSMTPTQAIERLRYR